MVALKLKDESKELRSTGSYDNDELVTYAEARRSADFKPYIAAVVTSSGVVSNKIILGDGRNTSDATLGRQRTTASNYYNGPLEPDTSYRIFQRIILNEKVRKLAESKKIVVHIVTKAGLNTSCY